MVPLDDRSLALRELHEQRALGDDAFTGLEPGLHLILIADARPDRDLPPRE